MKILSFVLLAFMMVGCATAPVQTYRPRNYDGPMWNIQAKQSKLGLIDSTYEILINGEKVIEGKFSDFQKNAEFTGLYQDHNISASFTRISDHELQIIVFVDGERAATF